MRWWWLALILALTSCTSTWERHHTALTEHEALGRDAEALAEARWILDNSFYGAPANERSPEAEAGRYLRVARLESRNGNALAAVEALREALAADPGRAPVVRQRLEQLPLSSAQLDAIRREFAWNIAVLAPHDDALLQMQRGPTQCWSYRVREVRIRRERTVQTASSIEHHVTYDARSWVFDASTRRWRADGEWVEDAGTEIEAGRGAYQARYRALTAAPHQFYTDGGVPPCHGPAWSGPYSSDGTVFVAAELPASR